MTVLRPNPDLRGQWNDMLERHQAEKAEFIMATLSCMTGLVERGTIEDNKLYDDLLAWLSRADPTT